MFTTGIDVTILWYNPNIQPKQEYEIRKEENLKYALKLGIGFVDLDYDVKEWYARVVGMEFEPERGPRCTGRIKQKHICLQMDISILCYIYISIYLCFKKNIWMYI
jgi:predicted adenine nucleotide alpha hydrolase (AANH) superfamily ATPase